MAANDSDLVISISTDVATLRRSFKKIEGDIAALSTGVTRQFNNVGKGIDASITTALQDRINGMVGIGVKASKEWNGALADQGKELDRLRAKYSPLFAAQQKYLAELKDIKAAHAVGALSAEEMANALQRTKASFAGTVASIKGTHKPLAEVAAASRLTSTQMLNLSRQGNDVITMFALGAAPMQIFASQAGQVYDALEQGPNGIKGSLSAIGASIASMINPWTVGFAAAVAGVTALGYYLSRTGTYAKSAEEVLKEFEAVVDEIGKSSESAGARIKEMLSQPETWANLRADANQVANDIQANLISKVNEAVDRMQAFITPWDEISPKVLAAQQHIRDLADDLGDGSKNASEVYDELSVMSTVDTYPPSLIDTINDLRTIIKEARNAQTQLAALKNFSNVEIQKGPRPGTNADLQDRLDMEYRFGGGDVESLVDRLNAQADGLKPKTTRGSGGGRSGGGGGGRDPAEAIKRVIDNLKFEGEQLTRTAEEQAVYNQLKAAGVDINTEAGQTIAELVRHNYELDEAQKAAKKSQEAFANGLQQLESDAIDALGQVIAGTEDAGDAFKKLAIEIVKSALTGKGAYADFFSSIFGGQNGGGGLLGMLFGGFGGGGGSSVDPWAGIRSVPGFASGTNYAPGGWAIAGERGPELINLPRGSQVFPTTATMPMLNRVGGGSSVSAPINISIDARGADKQGLARVQTQIASLKRDLPGIIVTTVQTKKKQNVKGL